MNQYALILFILFNGIYAKKITQLSCKTRSITVVNTITNKMLCYKKFFKTFEPTFYITANEKIIDQGQSAQIPITNNTIKISYNYSFINGYKKGAQQIIFTIPSERKTLNLGFSWSNKWRITTSSATPIKAQKLPYEEREQRSLLLTK